MRFDVGLLAAVPSCLTAPLSTSQRRRAQRERAHARVVLGVVRAVEALHGIPLAMAPPATPPAMAPQTAAPSPAKRGTCALHQDTNAANIVPDEELFATAMELGALQEPFNAAEDQNEEKADITPDEDSTATDKELSALQESFDTAGDRNGEKANITPDEDSTATDMDLSVLQASFDAAEDQNEEKADITPAGPFPSLPLFPVPADAEAKFPATPPTLGSTRDRVPGPPTGPPRSTGVATRRQRFGRALSQTSSWSSITPRATPMALTRRRLCRRGLTT